MFVLAKFWGRIVCDSYLKGPVIWKLTILRRAAQITIESCIHASVKRYNFKYVYVMKN